MLELMKEQELLMADIYLRLSELFPEYGDVYREMLSEEREHAGWIDHLNTLCVAEKASFAEGSTRTYTISSLIKYLRDFIAQLETKQMGHLKCLSYIIDIEQSLIERNAFQRFTGDSLEVMKVLKILEESQKVHVSKIKEFMGRLKLAA